MVGVSWALNQLWLQKLFRHNLRQIKAVFSFSFFSHCYANPILPDVSPVLFFFFLREAPLSDAQSRNFICSFCCKSDISVSNNLKANSRSSRLISLSLFYPPPPSLCLIRKPKHLEPSVDVGGGTACDLDFRKTRPRGERRRWAEPNSSASTESQ